MNQARVSFNNFLMKFISADHLLKSLFFNLFPAYPFNNPLKDTCSDLTCVKKTEIPFPISEISGPNDLRTAPGYIRFIAFKLLLLLFLSFAKASCWDHSLGVKK